MPISIKEFDDLPDLHEPLNQKEYKRKYRKEHPEKVREWQMKRNKKPDRIKYVKEYNKNHKEEIKASSKKWRKEHKMSEDEKKRMKAYMKKLRQSPKGKRMWREARHKRRGLGFIPLNDPFEGAEAHHVDKNHVVYIPKEIHSHIYHNLSKPETMVEINRVAGEYVTNFEEANNI